MFYTLLAKLDSYLYPLNQQMKHIIETEGIDDTVITILLNPDAYKNVVVDDSDMKSVIKAEK